MIEKGNFFETEIRQRKERGGKNAVPKIPCGHSLATGNLHLYMNVPWYIFRIHRIYSRSFDILDLNDFVLEKYTGLDGILMNFLYTVELQWLEHLGTIKICSRICSS